MSFDDDTALEPLGPGRWRAHLHERWSVARGPNGGYVGAIVARAAEQIAGRPLRSLTIHYLEAPDPGPVEVAATIEREGRSTTAATIRMERDGRPTALALAILGPWRDHQAEWHDAKPPQALPLEEAIHLDPSRSALPAFVGNFDMRWAIGSPPPQSGPGEGRTGGWIRTAKPQVPDAPRIVAFSDGWFPAAYARLGTVLPVPTLDLTVHIRSPLPPPAMRDDDHVLAAFKTAWGAGGVWEEDGELWSPGGVLLAQSRQLALVRGNV